jgi:hypothetical protein
VHILISLADIHIVTDSDDVSHERDHGRCLANRLAVSDLGFFLIEVLHFKAEQIREMLHAAENVTPIDSYMTGIKDYRRYVADIGTIQPMQLPLAPYKGQMGAGQVNTAKFLAAIGGEDAGTPMRFPNVSVTVGGVTAISPAIYFVGGEQLAYTVTIENGSIVTYEQQGNNMLFKGVKSGATTAKIKASNGQEQSFVITVSKSSGWL